MYHKLKKIITDDATLQSLSTWTTVIKYKDDIRVAEVDVPNIPNAEVVKDKPTKAKRQSRKDRKKQERKLNVQTKPWI